MFMRLVFNGFDDTVGSDCGDSQSVAQIPDGLMMGCIDLDVETAVAFRHTGNGRELGNFAARRDARGMDGIGRIRREAFLAVLNARVQFAGDVLVESAAEADVEALAAVADGEDRFGGSKSVVENCKISFFTLRVGVVGL